MKMLCNVDCEIRRLLGRALESIVLGEPERERLGPGRPDGGGVRGVRSPIMNVCILALTVLAGVGCQCSRHA